MWRDLNNTELAEILRRRTGRRFSKLNRDLLLAALEGEVVEKTQQEKTRKKLQLFVEPNFIELQTNFPCYKEPNKGRCQVHTCTDITHLSCLIGASSLMGQNAT